MSESPGNSGSPVNISAKRHPIAQMSTSGPYLKSIEYCLKSLVNLDLDHLEQLM